MSGLANRLRDAAWAEMRRFSRYHPLGGQRAVVDQAVAAVLRVLAQDEEHRDVDDWGMFGDELELLAEVIEKGEQA